MQWAPVSAAFDAAVADVERFEDPHATIAREQGAASVSVATTRFIELVKPCDCGKSCARQAVPADGGRYVPIDAKAWESLACKLRASCGSLAG
jgi:hypothetical protein